MLAGAGEEIAQDGHAQLAAADDRGEGQAGLALEVHLALAQQADGVAGEVELVEVDVLALDAEIDVALAEGVGVGARMLRIFSMEIISGSS